MVIHHKLPTLGRDLQGMSHTSGGRQLEEGKAKIYQGVRVKMTVKELLQQRRAKQAAVAEAVFGECSGNVQGSESLSPPCAVPYVDAESSLSSCLQPWQFQNGASCEEIPNYLDQLVDSCLQAEPPLEVPLALVQDHLPCSPESFQPSLTCLGSGSPEAPDPTSSFDYSYSLSQMLPSAPLGYGSPPLDGKSCLYPSPEERSCQQHTHVQHTSGLSTCYCTPCGSQHLDTCRAPEYFPYATVDCKDYAPSVSVADDFWKDRSWDVCYS
ncbi:colorectal cancer-associated protein 2 isoform X1 [Python bivittatus]|uniref:Colorectal cancer-associated protein 2 isoform X1 n=1 Tax=Python bivittatus TaxID=176946 RepID=A0A9F5N3V0_PYTBI|nr:colorectal cancer-associated protein 2 isoform X1 [Python bivittatus]